MRDYPPLSEIVKSEDKLMLVANSIKAIYDHTAKQASILSRLIISQQRTHVYIRHDAGDSANYLLLERFRLWQSGSAPSRLLGGRFQVDAWSGRWQLSYRRLRPRCGGTMAMTTRSLAVTGSAVSMTRIAAVGKLSLSFLSILADPFRVSGRYNGDMYET